MVDRLNNINDIVRDVSVAYFNNLNRPQFTVSEDMDGAVVSFFEQVAENKQAARALAGAVVYTAKAQNLEPIEILHKFDSLPKGELNSYLTMFLNLNRVSTSMLGLSNAPLANKYVTRTILP